MGNNAYDDMSPEELRRLLAQRDAHIEWLEPRAYYDELTGLYRRWFGEYLLERELERAKDPENGIRSIGVFFLDGNGLKKINDNFGHGVGDLAIKQIAQSVPSVLRHQRNEVVATWRRGKADEFLIALRNIERHSMESVAIRLGNLISARCFTHNRLHDGQVQTIRVSASIGGVWWPNYGGELTSVAELCDTADKLVYAARQEAPRPAGTNVHRIKYLSPSPVSVEQV